MSDTFLMCPICHKNFMVSGICDHDEFDLADRIAELEAEIEQIYQDAAGEDI